MGFDLGSSVFERGPGRRAVVTGSAGFIGSRLAARLCAGGWSVVGIDAFTDSYDPAEKEARASLLADVPGFSLVRGDVAELELQGLFRGADVVFHLAGRPGVRPSFDIEQRYVHDNVVATRRLLAAARAAGVRRLVYASSSSVYGNAPTPFAEAAPTGPISPYGRTKLEAERLCLDASDDGLGCTALRYFTVYGPGQRPDMGIRIFAEAALHGRPITVLGDGTQVRDFTYVDDVVDATIAAADGPVEGMAVNIGGGSTVTLNEVIEMLEGLVGHAIDADRVGFARGDVYRTEADLTRAKELLGFNAKVGFFEGLSAEVDWIRDRIEAMEGSLA